MLYAFGLDAGNIQYNSVDDSAILVTVNRDLTIVVSASPTGPAIYVDVPLENIVHTQIVSLWNDESQAHRYAVTIELSQIVGDHWHHNAVGQNSSTMSIAFTSQSHAELLSEFCRQSEKDWLTTRAPVMESQPINCSGTASHGRLARPNLASERLAEVALEAQVVLGQDLSTRMLQNNNASLHSTFQDRIADRISEPGTVAGNHEDTQRLASSVVSAVEGIDVSQHDTPSRGKIDTKIQNALAHTDGPAIEVPRTVATFADVEFEASPRHGSEGSIQQNQTSKSEDQGYDSTYDISPRPSRVQPKITENAVPVIQLDPLHPSGSNRILPVTGDGPIEGPPSSKLSRSLRNNNGKVEAGVESAPSLGLERAAGTPIEKITTSRPRVNHGVTASANSKVELQKPQLKKKAKEGKDRGNTRNGEDRENFEDEYDLPRSPEQQVRKASMIQDKSTSQAPDRETSLKQITKAKNVAKNPLRHSKEAKSKKVEPQPKGIASRASGVHKSKANPAADLTQPRSRRAAALIANKKIQGLEAFDEIGNEVEKSVSISRKPATTAETQDIHPSLTGITQEKILKNTDAVQASLSGNAKNGLVPVRDTAPSSRPDEDAIAEASIMEDVELVANITRHGIAQAGTTSQPSLPAPNSDILVAQGISSYGGVEKEVVGMTLNDDIHDRAPEAQNREKDFMPASIIKDFDAVSEVEDRPVIEPDLDMDEEVRPLAMVGEAEDSHFQEAMRDRGSIERGADGIVTNEMPDLGNKEATRQTEGHSHMAREEADDTNRANQHADPASTKPEKSKVNSGSSKATDPFVAKLSLLTPDNHATTSNAKESARLRTEQKFKASKEYIGRQQQFSDLNKGRRVQPRPQKDRVPLKQSVQAEQQRNIGHTQPQQAISEPNGPRLPLPAIENKRKAVRDGGGKANRPQLAPSSEHKAALHGISEGLQQAIGNTTSMSGHGKPMKPSSAEAQVADINRKPEIINFSARGPMNQGSASIKKPKPRIVTIMEADDNIKAAPRNDRETLKRKPARPVDDLAPSAYEHPPKRHKQDITPPAKHMHIAQMLPEPDSIIVQDKRHRMSSQSTRVNQNGSPMPSMHALNERVADTQGYTKEEVPTDQSLRDGFERFSSNRKRKCDSPTAPSNFASIPAHYMFNDGTLVNVQTEENIVSKEPQDPFIGARQAGTSDFMLALRRESGTEARSEDALLSEKKMGTNAKRGLPPSDEDPDKTLVEGQPPKKQRKHDISISSTTTSSSSGSTSSGGVSPSMDPSEAGDANILAEWQKYLNTHQRLMTSVLSDISRVSNANTPNA